MPCFIICASFSVKLNLSNSWWQSGLFWKAIQSLVWGLLPCVLPPSVARSWPVNGLCRTWCLAHGGKCQTGISISHPLEKDCAELRARGTQARGSIVVQQGCQAVKWNGWPSFPCWEGRIVCLSSTCTCLRCKACCLDMYNTGWFGMTVLWSVIQNGRQMAM